MNSISFYNYFKMVQILHYQKINHGFVGNNLDHSLIIEVYNNLLKEMYNNLIIIDIWCKYVNYNDN